MLDRKRTACFTGHRNLPENQVAKIKKLLDQTIEKLYEKGVIFFGVGGALGFDTEAEKAVLRAKEKHREIKLILVLPCKNQDKYWSDENKREYHSIIKKADKIVYTTENYSNGCMLSRNRHLVNYSGYCVCYLNQNRGGTAYTVNYAQNNGLTILNIFDDI